jgi:aminoacrylate hydrolase
MIELEHRKVSVADTILHAVSAGEGRPLVFIVGLGGSAEFWQPQFDAFAPTRRVISFDHRGTGRSAASDGPQSAADLARDTLAMLDALGVEEADVVGHSMGGAIAQNLATWRRPTPLFLELFRLRRAVLEQMGPEAYLRQGTFMAQPAWYLEERFTDAQAFFADRVAAFPGVATELSRIDAVMAHDLGDAVARIRAETLVVCARDDGITPMGMSTDLAAAIPGARLEILPHGGHFAPIVVADAYARTLRSFLDA